MAPRNAIGSWRSSVINEPIRCDSSPDTSAARASANEALSSKAAYRAGLV